MALTRHLQAAVFDEGLTVTYLTLAREKAITSEEAKRCGSSLGLLGPGVLLIVDLCPRRTLAEFKGAQGDAVAALYLVSGTLDGVRTFKLVDHGSLAGP